VTDCIADHRLAVMALRHKLAFDPPLQSDVAPINHRNVGIDLEEAALPITPGARAVSELLGIDPLHVANEGKVAFGVRAAAARRVIELLRCTPLGVDAAIIGCCVDEHHGMIVVDTGFGRRLLSEPEGELLPRIC
jgi:hydrogenase expression/formation protein HypE